MNDKKLRSKDKKIYPMKLTVVMSIYDEPDNYETTESQIKLMLANPQYAFDRHQALLRTLGTSKNFKYMTTGTLMRYEDQYVLSYEEDMLLGMSGELVFFYFNISDDKRGMVVIDRPTRGLRLALSDERCMANPAMVDKAPVIYTTLVHSIENTLSSTGGYLKIDYELSLYGVMIGRVRCDIKAVPASGDDEPYEIDEDTSLYLGRN